MLAKLPPTKQALLDAAQYIRVHGWKRGLGRHQGPRCAIGALLSVASYGGQVDDAAACLRNELSIGDLAAWNDHPSRTADEVIRALEQAALT